MNEVWKTMKYPYDNNKVSSLGNFKGFLDKPKRIIERDGDLNPRVYLYDSTNGKMKSVIAKTIVAQYFLDDYDSSLAVRTINGNHKDLRASNLQMYNPLEEMEDISLPTRSQIKELIDNNLTYKAIAFKCNVSADVMYKLIAKFKLRDYKPNATKLGTYLTGKCDEELWESVDGTDERLIVSNYGTVFDKKLKRTLTRTRGRTNASVAIRLNGKIKRFDVGKLVADNFVPNPNAFNFFNYLDGDRSNARADNIVWVEERPSVRKSQTFYSESSPEVQKLIRNIETAGITDYCDAEGISVCNIQAKLTKFGYPLSRSKIIQQLNHYRELGLEEDYIKGLTNIEKVELMEGEIRLPVPEFSGYYVTNYGRVITHLNFKKEHVLQCDKGTHSVYYEMFSVNNRKAINLAKLVASLFLPNPLNYTHIVHLDRDYKNCRADNLAWVSQDNYNYLIRGDGRDYLPSEYLTLKESIIDVRQYLTTI